MEQLSPQTRTTSQKQTTPTPTVATPDSKPQAATDAVANTTPTLTTTPITTPIIEQRTKNDSESQPNVTETTEGEEAKVKSTKSATSFDKGNFDEGRPVGLEGVNAGATPNGTVGGLSDSLEGFLNPKSPASAAVDTQGSRLGGLDLNWNQSDLS
ncbi:hypothetical protein B0H34DRAFT_381812 [Crassisporium funariophilum]|nr:hypothetical protein B0H34DRAFT_381812 [Crassisporium funariophilum]